MSVGWSGLEFTCCCNGVNHSGLQSPMAQADPGAQHSWPETTQTNDFSPTPTHTHTHTHTHTLCLSVCLSVCLSLSLSLSLSLPLSQISFAHIVHKEERLREIEVTADFFAASSVETFSQKDDKAHWDQALLYPTQFATQAT